jgi:hypothetical protein
MPTDRMSTPPTAFSYPLTSTAYYYQGRPTPFAPDSFYQIGHGMFGGPNGTYGSYSYGPNVQPVDMKNDRQRQTGE